MEYLQKRYATKKGIVYQFLRFCVWIHKNNIAPSKWIYFIEERLK